MVPFCFLIGHFFPFEYFGMNFPTLYVFFYKSCMHGLSKQVSRVIYASRDSK